MAAGVGSIFKGQPFSQTFLCSARSGWHLTPRLLQPLRSFRIFVEDSQLVELLPCLFSRSIACLGQLALYPFIPGQLCLPLANERFKAFQRFLETAQLGTG